MTLGTVIHKWREASGINLRDAAKEIGVSYPTLSRLENGHDLDGDTLVTVICWMLGRKERK